MLKMSKHIQPISHYLKNKNISDKKKAKKQDIEKTVTQI